MWLKNSGNVALVKNTHLGRFQSLVSGVSSLVQAEVLTLLLRFEEARTSLVDSNMFPERLRKTPLLMNDLHMVSGDYVVFAPCTNIVIIKITVNFFLQRN